MTSLIPQSKKWGPVLEIAFVLFAFAIGTAFGVLAFHTRTVQPKSVERARISAHASLAQVNANFAGKPYVTAPLSELPGFTCSGWTNGKSSHGWVVIRCTR